MSRYKSARSPRQPYSEDETSKQILITCRHHPLYRPIFKRPRNPKTLKLFNAPLLSALRLPGFLSGCVLFPLNTTSSLLGLMHPCLRTSPHHKGKNLDLNRAQESSSNIRFISDEKCSILVSNVDKGPVCACVGT